MVGPFIEPVAGAEASASAATASRAHPSAHVAGSVVAHHHSVSWCSDYLGLRFYDSRSLWYDLNVGLFNRIQVFSTFSCRCGCRSLFLLIGNGDCSPTFSGNFSMPII